MTSDSVSNGSVEPDPSFVPEVDPSVETARRTRRRRWGIAIFAAVMATIVAALFLIRLPYFVISPGSVRPSEQRIHISGTKGFNTPGKVMFTTVYIDQATPALLIRAWLDDSFEVRTKKEMYPDGDTKAARQENVALMDSSKVLATKVALTEVGIPAEFGGSGVQVVKLLAKSPSKGILKAGDVITEVDGGDVAMPDDISKELEDRSPGDLVSVVVQRANRRGDGFAEKRLEVTMGAAGQESTGDPNRPVFGIQVQAYGLKVVSDVHVKVDSGDVTGPSAGLAWTLAIIDRLTPGSLTDKRDIAVTGEIRADGTVGPIGGIEQKVAAVKRAGIKVFIYPSETPKADQAAIQKLAGDGLALHPVANIEEAVKVLDPNWHGKP